MTSTTHWIPLESNPEVLDEFALKMGVLNVPTAYQFCDVLGLDDELLSMVPSPALAVICLFPITRDTEQLRKEEEESGVAKAPPFSVYYMKQTIGNACGTIALLHAVANAQGALQLAPDSFMSKFLAETRDMSPEERGKFLEAPPEGAPSLDAMHEEMGQKGVTEAPPADADIELHFVAFVEVDGHVWELDGRKAGAIDHGPTEGASLLHRAAQVVRRNFVERSSSLNFSLIALAAADD